MFELFNISIWFFLILDLMSCFERPGQTITNKNAWRRIFWLETKNNKKDYSLKWTDLFTTYSCLKRNQIKEDWIINNSLSMFDMSYLTSPSHFFLLRNLMPCFERPGQTITNKNAWLRFFWLETKNNKKNIIS